MNIKYTKEQLKSICESVKSMVETIVNKYPDSTQEIKNLKIKLLECTLAEDAMEIINQILTLQLDYMNEHPELYPKYK